MIREVPGVETPPEIVERWRAEGNTYIRAADVTAEFRRQGREAVRAREDNILTRVAAGETSPALLELAQQIRDHRDAGQYTTQG